MIRCACFGYLAPSLQRSPSCADSYMSKYEKAKKKDRAWPRGLYAKLSF